MSSGMASSGVTDLTTSSVVGAAIAVPGVAAKKVLLWLRQPQIPGSRFAQFPQVFFDASEACHAIDGKCTCIGLSGTCLFKY